MKKGFSQLTGMILDFELIVNARSLFQKLSLVYKKTTVHRLLVRFLDTYIPKTQPVIEM